MKKLLLIAFAIFCNISLYYSQAPANDNCSNAINLTLGAACTPGTTVNSTFDGILPSCGGTNSNVGNVWYKFTATSASTVISVANVTGSLDPVLAVYTSCSGNSIDCEDYGVSNEGESIILNSVANTTYYINVKQYDSDAGTFCIDVKNIPPLTNDNCANAINLTVGASCTPGSTFNSTFDGNLPSCGGTNSTVGNVWYQFTATSTLTAINLTNVTGSLDPVLSVYTSCSGNSIDCEDYGVSNEGETILLNSVVNTTYYINVKQYDSDAGTFCIEVKNIPPVTNDNCANAVNLTVGAPCTTGSTIGSTFDGNLPSCGGSNVSAGNVWYKFTATSTSSIINLSTVTNSLDPVLAVYTTCSGNSVQCSDYGVSNQDETITFNTLVGAIYLINVKQYDSDDGTFCIEVKDQLTTSVEDRSVKLLIYPNPVSDNITIETNAINNSVIVNITNMLGQVVKTFTVNKNLNNINVSEIERGTYILQIPEWNISKMIIKN